MKVEITKEMFDVAYSLSKQRQGRFRNQFTTKKLREQLSDDPILEKHVEGIFGYIGDMCASVALGLDPKNVMRNMVLDTDLLSHRDECDVIFRGHRIDVKTEFYPEEKFESVINKTITKKETYGCRLINDNQFRENSHGIDIYLYGTIDNLDPRKAKYWYGIGWITTEKAKLVAPEPMWWSPSGARLWTPAHCIPNEDLDEFEILHSIEEGDYPFYSSFENNPKYSVLDKERMNEILNIAGLD